MNSVKFLQAYHAKRDFSITPEPTNGGTSTDTLQFVIQKHWASSLHYDFRLELNGVMKSSPIPKGPSYDSSFKRTAIRVNDHPIAYSSFEGIIPGKQYGAGKVIIWDKGYCKPFDDPNNNYAKGNLKFELFGLKVHVKWVLEYIKNQNNDKQGYLLLIKEKNSLAKSTQDFSLVDGYPDSVKEYPFPQLSQPTNFITAEKSAKKNNAQQVTRDISQKAIKADLPEQLKPQLATLAEKIPADTKRYITEIKFDGYRLLVQIKQGGIKLFT